MGRYVAKQAAQDLRNAIRLNGHANLIVATGASQFEVLSHLTQEENLDWNLVHGFHLDEYVGIDTDHEASFCRYLNDRFVGKVSLGSFHFMRGDRIPTKTIKEASEAIAQHPIDVALVGIGENGHLAFNDPPADFATVDPYLLVELDEPCRRQQVGEGWFDGIDDVPTHAISMSVRQIMKSNRIYCSVPDERKAAAVRDTLCGSVTPDVPASILKEHPRASLVLDRAAASKLPAEMIARMEPDS